MINETDQKILDLLQVNARLPVSDLARKLGVSRTTVQSRLDRLEADGVIKGYTIRLADEKLRNKIRALVTIKVETGKAVAVISQLKKMTEVDSLHSVSGRYDFVAFVSGDNPEAVDQVLDRFWEIDGILNTESALILSTKLNRR
jgi:DNA-binding Lrp family transcriptional regulator